MKNWLTLSFFAIFYFCCNRSQAQLKPVEQPDSILSSTVNFLIYNRDYIRFAEDFATFDTQEKPMDKKAFFQLLSTGNYLPLRLASKDPIIHYKLYKISPSVNQDTRSAIHTMLKIAADHYAMVGKKLPQFDFVDINGNRYNEENTKGKIIVLKCWYIGCVACNAEIPELNKLVDSYKGRKDVEFVSLALDPKEKLISFSKKKTFKYAIVPVKRSYLDSALRVYIYPTHMIINKSGIVSRTPDAAGEVVTALRQEAGN